MPYVAITVILATAVGVAAERRLPVAPRLARMTLALMLYALVPFISFVNIVHLHITLAGVSGIGFAYVAAAVGGLLAYCAGRALRLSRPGTGALICCVILVNTGYLGYPMTVALLGGRQLPLAIVYDQLISGPTLFLAGFGVGAAFGTKAGEGLRARSRAFFVRNPPLLAVIAALVAPSWLAPAVLVRASHSVVIALLPLGFFVVGVNLSAERRAEGARLLQRPDRPVAVAVALRLLVTPLVMLAASLAVVRLPSAYLVEAAMPTAVNSLLVGHAYGLDQRLIASAIMWSTLATVLVGLIVSAV